MPEGISEAKSRLMEKSFEKILSPTSTNEFQKTKEFKD